MCRYKNYSYQLPVPYIIYAGFEAITESICDALLDLVHLYNLKNVKNTHVGVLLLVKLQVPNHALHHTCTKKITRIILRRVLKTSSLWLWI